VIGIGADLGKKFPDHLLQNLYVGRRLAGLRGAVGSFPGL